MRHLEAIPEVSAIWDSGQANCAQSTCKGLLEHFKCEEEAGNVLFSSFIPFGGGFMSGNICGAVSGTLAAISYILSKKDSSMEEIMQITTQMKAKFVDEFGSPICAEILAPLLDKAGLGILDLFMMYKEQSSEGSDSSQISVSEFYAVCTSCVHRASAIAKELIEKSD